MANGVRFCLRGQTMWLELVWALRLNAQVGNYLIILCNDTIQILYMSFYDAFKKFKHIDAFYFCTWDVLVTNPVLGKKSTELF